MADQSFNFKVAEAEVKAPAGGKCDADKISEPLIMVLFGATGDLAARKVLPAVQGLLAGGFLPENFVLVGSARTKLSDEEFRADVKKAFEEYSARKLEGWEKLESRLFYHAVQYDDLSTFTAMAERLASLDEEFSTQGNKLFYVALPPQAYEPVAEMLGKAGLSRQHDNGNGLVRIVVEKPFGHDLPSAKKLDKTLHHHFRERQIFRIDHYMAKETVQNVLMLRFANALFEPVWNRNHIDWIEITAAESLGVEHRAAYYDTAGVLRDMFQNHMMMLLSLCAMEPPSIYEPERVRDEKSKVFRSLRPFPVGHIKDRLVLGRYGPGTVKGEEVPGYMDEEGVDPDSTTPTFALMKVFLDNWRWQDVPIFITSGKRMSEKRTEIAVQFKCVPSSLFRNVLDEHITSNRLVMGIQPDESVTLEFQAKVPGSKMCLRTVEMKFDYKTGYGGPTLDGYEKILLDCMLGDQTLFWRQDQVELCWGFLTPILEECECEGSPVPLLTYPAGSDGPEEAVRELRGEFICNTMKHKE